MKAVAQAFTFEELDAIWNALRVISRQEEPLPLATESTETAFEKTERAIEDTYSQQQHDVHFLIVPVAIEEIIKEQ